MARQFRPQKWSLIGTLLMCFVLVGLGTWQLNRLAWKTDFLHRIQAGMAARAVPLPEKIADPKDWEYRRVTMAGQFLYKSEFLIKPRVMNRQSGYHMVVPFRRISGGIVFVNRGWISDDLMQKVSRPRGIVQVEGIIQAPEKYRFTPENNAAKGDWYWMDTGAMAAAAQLKNVAPFVVTVAAQQEGVYPVGGQLRLDIPNDHRQYAIFWYVMAFLLASLYFAAHFQPVEDKDAGL